MKTKKIFAVALALLMVLELFAGCNSTSTNGNTTTPTPAPTEAAKTPAPATPAPAAEGEGESKGEAEPAPAGGATYVEHASKGKIKVGHLVDLTGVEAATGNQAKTAFDFAAQNALLIGEYEIEVIERDCQSNSGFAATAAAELVESGVVAIFGPTQIGHKSAVANQLADDGVPLILYNGTPAGMMRASQWVVGEGGGTNPFPTVMAHYAYEQGLRKVYTIRQDTTGGDNYVGPFEDEFTKLGGEIIQSVRLTVGGSDYSSLLATFTDPEADAIVGWTSSADAINFWTSWYELGLSEKLPVLATMHGGFTDFYVMKQLDGKDPAIADAIVANETKTVINYCYSIDNEQNAEFLEIWTAGQGAIPAGNNLAGACWQAIEVLERALSATNGDTDPETLLDAIFSVDFTGPEGHVFFANGQQAASKDVNVSQVVRLDDGSYNYQVVETYNDIGVDGYTG